MKKVVIEGSTVTVGQCKDLFRMIGDGTIGFAEMQRFLERPIAPFVWVTAEQLEVFFACIKDKTIGFAEVKAFLEHPKGEGVLSYPSAVRAINILGHKQVITVQSAYRIWDLPYSLEERHTLDQIKYSEATLRKCAAENRKDLASWHLVYIIGYSLQEQRQKLGIIPDGHLCFRKGYDWFLDEKERYWADQTAESGYYLINFQDFGTHGLSYPDQLKKVEELGPGYGVLDPQMFSEAVISIKKKDRIGIAMFWGHRPLSQTSAGKTIAIGDFSADEGLTVEQRPLDWKYGSLRMTVYRKHDLQ